MRVFDRGHARSAGIEASLREAITGLRPLLGGEGHVVELVSFDATTGTATLRLSGACPDCDMTLEMLTQGIEAHLRRHVPALRTVRTISS
jgi:Fe-S cluster biogenesis protein NfuA